MRWSASQSGGRNPTVSKMQFKLKSVLLELLNISCSPVRKRSLSLAVHLYPVKNLHVVTKHEKTRLPLSVGRRALRTSPFLNETSGMDGGNEDTAGHKSESTTGSTVGDRLSYLEARRRGVLQGRRRLSPLQRVGGMITGVSSSVEKVETELKESHTVEEQGCNVMSTNPDLAQKEHELQYGKQRECSASIAHPGQMQVQSAPFVDGEYVIITRENLKRQEKLIRLIKLDANLEFKCKFGNLLHADIIGRRNGSIFVTGMDLELLVRRPSLEEYVLYMKRTPVIAYPKDCCSMLMMIDASPGDVVLEAGSGSGAMTLFLSRAVGHSGQVLSFERMEAHQKKARKNFENWHNSWDLSHDIKWPDNVTFHQTSLEDCGKYVGEIQVDGAVIDMEEPWRVMQTMSARLKTGKTMALYVANLTQVIDVAEAIRKQRLPLILETTLEVSHKIWVVNPARRHAGIVLGESVLVEGDELSSEDGETVQGVQYVADKVPRYLTRPHHMQPSHTAFLVKIRRVLTSSSTFKV